jgi:hypothetical protein
LSPGPFAPRYEYTLEKLKTEASAAEPRATVRRAAAERQTERLV